MTNYIWVVEERKPRCEKWKPCNGAMVLKREATINMNKNWKPTWPDSEFRVRKYAHLRK